MGDKAPSFRLVWILRHGRLSPEKWPHDAPQGCVVPIYEREVVGEHPLSEEEAGLSLGELAAKYPGPALP